MFIIVLLRFGINAIAIVCKTPTTTHIIHFVLHKILYVNESSKTNKQAFINCCQNSLGTGTLSRSAVNHNPPHKRTIAQNNITITHETSRQSVNICSADLSLKYFIACL